MPLFRNEDAAVKAKLAGLSVSDAANAARPVAVRYRDPEDELSDLTFPIILLERVDVTVDPARAHAGYIALPYAPEGYQAFPQQPDSRHSPYFTEFPVPLFVDYAVTLLARKAAHATALTAALSVFDRLPLRYGYLVVPQDSTVRRLDVTGGPLTSTVLDGAGKRLFRAVWRVRTTAELIWAPVDTPVPAASLDLTVTPIGPAT